MTSCSVGKKINEKIEAISGENSKKLNLIMVEKWD